MVDLASEIAGIVGFTYKIVPTDGYGSVGKDGRWNGMIRELLEEVAIHITITLDCATMSRYSCYSKFHFSTYYLRY